MKTYGEKSAKKNDLTGSPGWMKPPPIMAKQHLTSFPGGNPFIQPKLRIGEPDDQYEQEADRVADRVMTMPEPKQASNNGQWSLGGGRGKGSIIQRQTAECPECGDAEEGIQRQVDSEEEEEPEKEEEEPLQAKFMSNKSPPVTPGFKGRIQSMRGRGQPLSASTRAFFEPRFGHDFGSVRVHTGGEASETARAINAKAFTWGSHITFNQSQYSPNTVLGKRLLAHELVHTIQQKSSVGKAPSVIQCKQIGRISSGGKGTGYFTYELDRKGDPPPPGARKRIYTLSQLARYYGTTVSEIKAMNPDLNSRKPRPGEQIKVPAIFPPKVLPTKTVPVGGKEGVIVRPTPKSIIVRWSPHSTSNRLGTLKRGTVVPSTFAPSPGGFTSFFIEPTALKKPAPGIGIEVWARGHQSGGNIIGYAPTANVIQAPFGKSKARLALAVAYSEYRKSVRESPQCTNRGPEVDKYIGRARRKVSFNGTRCGVAWCAHFIKWCLNQVGISHGITGRASSVKTWGESRGFYHPNDGKFKPQTGDIFFMKPTGGATHPCDTHPCVPAGHGSGHAGFVWRVGRNNIYTIEGNVHISNTGDGLSSRYRKISAFLGFLRIP